MAVFDEDIGAGLSLADNGAAASSPPMSASALQPDDWKSRYEQAYARAQRERARADAGEARCEELRWAEVDSRARAGSLKWQLDKSRTKLKAAVEETKEVRRAAKSAPSLQGEVARLEKLLSQAGVETSKRSTNVSLRMEVARLREAVPEACRPRGAPRRSRNPEETIASLREANVRLRAEVRDLKDNRTVLASRAEKREAQLEKLRATRSVLSKALFGSNSEQQKKPRSGRRRGQQPGAAGHGRMQRPELGERTEKRNPPKDARVCSSCAKPYVANGERVTTVIEIDVKAHKRRIARPRWRRGCDCASSPREVTAAPQPRLFDTTPYGISVWTCILFERFVCCRPLHRVSAWLADMGLAISPCAVRS